MKTIWRTINDKIWKTGSTSGEDTSRGSGNKTTTVTSETPTYYGAADEFYIGISSDKATTVYLPRDAEDGRIIIVKAEMKPPLGSRKVNITTTDGSKIDGYSDADINVSHGYRILIRNHGEWFIIS